MHATAPKFLVYHIQVNVKDLPSTFLSFQMHHFTMFTHDNPKITHLAVSENVVYLKVVMFIIFHTKNVDK